MIWQPLSSATEAAMAPAIETVKEEIVMAALARQRCLAALAAARAAKAKQKHINEAHAAYEYAENRLNQWTDMLARAKESAGSTGRL